MRKHYIIATAGHVDHGKTSLIKALTGKDCDTHPEEKQRGITIYLGFSHLKLSDDVYAGIVDVPGHKDFIDTMISGIHAIDLVLFVIAADESFMPQTYEHLHILDTLGVKKGIIILTKCDLVDPELLSLAKDDIREHIANTFLEGARIITTSVVSGKHIKKVKPAILSALTHEKRRATPTPVNLDSIPLAKKYTKSHQIHSTSPTYFRLYPDRFFQVRGFGSVVTGTVRSGSIAKNLPLYIVPGDKEIRIRRIEAYGAETERVRTGQRASLNLTNFAKEDYKPGIMLCDHKYTTTDLIDVEMSLFDGVSPLNVWSTVEFHIATVQSQARIHLIDTDKLCSGKTCLAQIHLERPITACYGDKFIIRNTSGVQTLGGGRIVDAFPLHHRRRTEKVKQLLAQRTSGNLVDLICTEIEKSIKPVSLEQISYRFMDSRLLQSINLELLASKLPDKYLTYGDLFWLSSEQIKLSRKIVKFLSIAHKNNPMYEDGKPLEDLVALLGDFPERTRPLITKRILDQLIAENQIELRHQTYALTSHKVNLSKTDFININWVDQYLLNQKMKTPLMSDLTEKCKYRGVDEKRLKQILLYLIAKKKVVYQNGEYLHTEIVNPIRTKLLEYLKHHPEGCSVSEFRDLIDGNRKICVVLLNIFDREGIITRDDEDRRHLAG